MVRLLFIHPLHCTLFDPNIKNELKLFWIYQIIASVSQRNYIHFKFTFNKYFSSKSDEKWSVGRLPDLYWNTSNPM